MAALVRLIATAKAEASKNFLFMISNSLWRSLGIALDVIEPRPNISVSVQPTRCYAA